MTFAKLKQQVEEQIANSRKFYKVGAAFSLKRGIVYVRAICEHNKWDGAELFQMLEEELNRVDNPTARDILERIKHANTNGPHFGPSMDDLAKLAEQINWDKLNQLPNGRCYGTLSL
jgi:hypothetical protein